MELYNKILENDEKPSIEFLCTLANLLQTNKYPLPQGLIDSDEPKSSLNKAL